MITRPASATAAAIILLASSAAAPAGPTMPAEFSAAGTHLHNLASLGGVASYASTLDPGLVHSGDSLLVTTDLVSGSFLNFSSFTLGATLVTPPDLSVAPGADTFSVSAQWPGPQTMSFYITIREDDDGDGSVTDDDDMWESPDVFLEPGTRAYNIPAAAFELANPGSGNGLRDFATTPRMAYSITFESRPTYPGGRITTPVSFRIDHLGFYAGNQSIPAATCPADWNADAAVNSGDISAFLTAWLGSVSDGTLAADFSGDGAVNSGDISAFLTAWLAAVADGC